MLSALRSLSQIKRKFVYIKDQTSVSSRRRRRESWVREGVNSWARESFRGKASRWQFFFDAQTVLSRVPSEFDTSCGLTRVRGRILVIDFDEMWGIFVWKVTFGSFLKFEENYWTIFGGVFSGEKCDFHEKILIQNLINGFSSEFATHRVAIWLESLI